MEILEKLKIELLYDLAIPLLDIILKVLKSGSYRSFCTTMFIAALYTISTIWKQNIHLQMNKENIYTYSGILFGLQKGNYAICNNRHQSVGYYSEWSKQVSGHIVHDSTCMTAAK